MGAAAVLETAAEIPPIKKSIMNGGMPITDFFTFCTSPPVAGMLIFAVCVCMKGYRGISGGV
jgi:hypothetical protein